MAKQLVNPFERHVEKGVLGVCGLLLLGVIAKYLVSTPNRVELGGESVTPANIDSKVREKAGAVQNIVRNAKAPPPAPFELPPFDPSLSLGDLVAAAPFLPPVPLVDKVEPTRGGRKLAEVPALSKPVLNRGRSTVDLPTGFPNYAELKGVAITDWVNITAIFDHAAMSARLEDEYGNQRRTVIYGGVEVQRRAKRADGTWSDDDWAALETWPAVAVPPSPPVPLVDVEGSPTIRKADHEVILKWIESLREYKTQQEIVRPLMRKIVNGDCWQFPVLDPPFKERNILLQDEDFRLPNEAPTANPDNRYPSCKEVVPAPSGGTEAAPAVTPAMRVAKLDERLKVAQDTCREEICREIQTEITAILDLTEATAADKSKARAVEARLKNTLSDIKAGTCKPKGGAKVNRELQPQQEIWAFDAMPSSLAPGHVYQYRMRPLILNPRVGEPDQFRTPTDATVLHLPGAWSDASNPIHIEPALYYFLSAEKDQSQTRVRAEFYQWFQGDWIKPTSPRIAFELGARLTARARAKTRDPADRTKIITPEVLFDAAATIVGVDPDRSFRDRKGVGKSGVDLEKGATACILLVHDNGDLEERFESLDKVTPMRKVLQERSSKLDSVKPGP